MPVVPLGSLPDDARVWVFAAERALTPDEADAVLRTVDGFLGVWAAHGHPLTSGRELRESRFLVIAVDEAAAGASGCSIDVYGPHEKNSVTAGSAARSNSRGASSSVA